MKKALITGISGFVGSHLSELLIAQNIQVFGITHPKHNSENLNFIKDKLELITCDILDKKTIEKILRKTNFQYIFHLAAYSSPIESFKNPDKILENNIIGQLNLLEILVKLNSSARILIVGSSDEYGKVDLKNLPVNEQTPLSPQSPYAVSKVAQDFLGYQYFLHHKLNLVRARPFNHIGPRQSNTFVVSSFASQIAKIETQGGGEIKVGNLNSFRDFTDVRDVVRAYLLALAKGKFGEVYNIGSGKLYKIEDILNMLILLSKVKIKITHDKKLTRVKDDTKIYCDFAKFNMATGWKPQIPIKKTLSDTIDYERSKLN